VLRAASDSRDGSIRSRGAPAARVPIAGSPDPHPLDVPFRPTGLRRPGCLPTGVTRKRASRASCGCARLVRRPPARPPTARVHPQKIRAFEVLSGPEVSFWFCGGSGPWALSFGCISWAWVRDTCGVVRASPAPRTALRCARRVRLRAVCARACYFFQVCWRDATSFLLIGSVLWTWILGGR